MFDRENPGFDVFVGNPPFLGGSRISTANGASYCDIIYDKFEQSGNRMDLCAYFFRQAFDLLRRRGTLGLVATNTIAQADTRKGGLSWICTHDGTIYEAFRRKRWPGQAAVVISVVHIHKGAYEGQCKLDDGPVALVTAYLFHAGGHDDPAMLVANAGKSFQGSFVLGMGFTFDDTDTKGIASPLAEMRRLIAKDPRNAERIFPYIGGEEINDSPDHSNHRFIINFGVMSESEARRWPDLMEILEERVKPDRVSKPGSYSREWWLYGSAIWRDKKLFAS